MSARAYFASTPWSVIENLNSALCQGGGYQVGRTSDGYDPAREMWEASHRLDMDLIRAAQLCQCCHRTSPFLFLKGNTFVAAARIALKPAFEGMTEERRSVARSGIGHYIAGTIGETELQLLLGAQ